MSKFGYAWTWYDDVTTDDNWTLTLFRITGKEGQDPVVSKHPPVLLQHGSTMDAESWIGSYFAGVPMPLQLVDAGFDVWMGNNRGTKYSAEYTGTKDKWDYSWGDMGLYDVPAFINKIVETTDQP